MKKKLRMYELKNFFSENFEVFFLNRRLSEAIRYDLSNALSDHQKCAF